MLNPIQRLLCAIQGHDLERKLTDTKVYMRCILCTKETEGWELDASRPKARFEGDPNRHRMETNVNAQR